MNEDHRLYMHQDNKEVNTMKAWRRLFIAEAMVMSANGVTDDIVWLIHFVMGSISKLVDIQDASDRVQAQKEKHGVVEHEGVAYVRMEYPREIIVGCHQTGTIFNRVLNLYTEPRVLAAELGSYDSDGNEVKVFLVLDKDDYSKVVRVKSGEA